MPTKPAAGTPLDPAHALYSHLTAAGSAVWGMLEGTGTTSADSSGNGNTLTLSTGASWSSDATGPKIALTGNANPLPLTSAITYDGNQSYSIAFRGLGSSGAFGSVCGNGTEYIGFYYGNYFNFVTRDSNYSFYGATVFSAAKDYVVVFNFSTLQARLYTDGVEDSVSPFVMTAGHPFIFDRLGSGFAGFANPLIGSLNYFYGINGYAASIGDAVALHTNPYAIFTSVAPSPFTAAALSGPSTAAASFAITVPAASSFTASVVSGPSVAAASFAAAPPGAAAFTGTLASGASTVAASFTATPPAAGTAYTSNQAGNWATAAIWTPNGVPGAGDTVTIGHAVAVTANTTIGDGSDSTVLTCITGKITVTGAALTIRGRGTWGGVSDLLVLVVQNAGATPGQLILDGGAGHTPVQTFGGGSKLTLTGTVGAPFVVRTKVATAGSPGYFVCTNGSWGLSCRATYGSFIALGDASHAAIGIAYLSYAPDSDPAFVLNHCTFDTCGTVTVQIGLGTAVFTLNDCLWQNGLAPAFTLMANSAKTGGDRTVAACTFLGLHAVQPYFGYQQDVTFTGCYFDDDYTCNWEGYSWAAFDGCFVRLQTTGEHLSAGDFGVGAGNYFFTDGGGGSFWLISDMESMTFANNVFDPSQATSYGYAIGYTEASNGPRPSCFFEYNVMCLSAQPWSLLAAVTNSAAPNVLVGTAAHNTVPIIGAAPVVIGAAGPGERVGSVAAIRDNLFWGTGTPTYPVVNQGTPTLAVTDVVTAPNCHHNAYSSVAVESAGRWTGTPYTIAGATTCTNGTPYSTPMSGATAPGGNDVNLGTITNAQTQGPQFVDPTRNLLTWDASRGGPGTAANAMAAIRADLTLIPAAVAWVRGGFVPTNTLLHNTASDGTDIGAVAFAGSATAFTLTAPSPAKGDVTVVSSPFTITPNGTFTGTITVTPSGGGLSTPIVKTFSGTSTPQTFTITPTVAGAVVTLTATNSGGLTNPAPVTYLGMVQIGKSGTNAVSGNLAPSLGGQDLCSVGVWPREFARDITGDAVDPSNAGFQGVYGGSHLHVDFSATGAGGQYGGYGIPFNVVPGTQATKAITYVGYPSANPPDPTHPSDPGPIPIPDLPACENWTDQSVSPSTNPAGDGHILIAVRDETTGLVSTLWEINKGWTEDSGVSWKASGAFKFNIATGAQRADDTTSAEAGGMRILPALLRADEVIAAIARDPVNGDVGHCIRVTFTADQNKYTWPAKVTVAAGTSPAPAMGARFRLTSAWYAANAASYTGQARIIINTIRKYGLIMADIGGTWYVGGVSDDRWSLASLTAINGIPGSALELIRYTPGWTHTGPTSGPVGTPQTFTVALGWPDANAQSYIYLTLNGATPGGSYSTPIITLIPGSSPSGTYTFTPPSAGVYTLHGATGGLEWYPPAPLTFTAGSGVLPRPPRRRLLTRSRSLQRSR